MALLAVEQTTRRENDGREWARRAVKATGAFPELVSAGAAGRVAVAANAEPAGDFRLVYITIPAGAAAGEQVMIDTPHGRFAVTVPVGVSEGEPMLVPLPLPTSLPSTPRDSAAISIEIERERQLRTLMELGFHAQARMQPPLETVAWYRNRWMELGPRAGTPSKPLARAHGVPASAPLLAAEPPWPTGSLATPPLASRTVLAFVGGRLRRLTATARPLWTPSSRPFSLTRRS